MHGKTRFKDLLALKFVSNRQNRQIGPIFTGLVFSLLQGNGYGWSPRPMAGSTTQPSPPQSQLQLNAMANRLAALRSQDSLLRLPRPLPVSPLSSFPQPGLHWNSRFGTPSFMEGRALFVAMNGRPDAMAFFHAHRDKFKLENPESELRLRKASTDGMGFRHESYQQVYQGIPVWNGSIHCHFDPSGKLYAVNAAYAPTPRFPAPPQWRLGEKEAIESALSDLQKRVAVESMDAGILALLDYAGPIAERNVWRDSETGAARMAWRVEVRPNICEWWRYFIDAETGTILEKYDASNSDGPKTASATDLFGKQVTLNTYQVGSAYYLIDGTRQNFNSRSGLPANPKGALWTMTAGNTDLRQVSQVTSNSNTWNDAAAVSAHDNLAKVYEYYRDTFNRLGIDGAGSTTISVVHVTQNGQPMDNAYWNGKLMAYGDGNRTFNPLPRALDVTGHELTHGVISATVNLEYKSQSGALNESLADIFGAMIDRDDWKMGEDIVKSASYPTGALRSLDDPHNGGRSSRDPSWQPAHMSEYVKANLDQDNGGVHINSGIPSHACYLIAEAIGREKTENIYYRVLDARYLNPGSQFIDMRLGAVRAATDLFGETSPEVSAVRDAFTAVGIGDANSSDIPKPRPADHAPASGDQFVALIHAKSGDSSLYLAKSSFASASDIVQLTRTQVYSGSGKPISVSRDGGTILFIDTRHALRSIDASGEHVVDSTNDWKSVAISPDGMRAALTTLEPDAKIHLLDLAHPDQSRSIKLYTPTTGQETQADNVVYADAVEFNSSGESLVFDALSRVTLSSGAPLDYWNASLLDIGSGIISPFLSSLPDGMSIGNPSFAQTNDLNVTFDLIDERTGKFSVATGDLFMGRYRVIDSGSSVPGAPRYSTRDDQVIFTRADANALNVYRIPMSPDKFTPAGKAVQVANEFQKPLWFAKVAATDLFPPANPRDAGMALQLIPGGDLRLKLPGPAELRLSVFDASGRGFGKAVNLSLPAGEATLPWTGPVLPGVYWVRVEAKPAAGPGRIFVRQVMR